MVESRERWAHRVFVFGGSRITRGYLGRRESRPYPKGSFEAPPFTPLVVLSTLARSAQSYPWGLGDVIVALSILPLESLGRKRESAEERP